MLDLPLTAALHAKTLIEFDAGNPDVIRSAFWIRIHGARGSDPKWRLIVAVNKPSSYYDRPILGCPSLGAIIEGVEDRNNLLVTQVVETTGWEPITLEQQPIDKRILIDAVVYKSSRV